MHIPAATSTKDKRKINLTFTDIYFFLPYLFNQPCTMSEKKFQPFVAPETQMKEFTAKALIMGSFFGILFGAATVYLALKAGLTVSASNPIAHPNSGAVRRRQRSE